MGSQMLCMSMIKAGELKQALSDAEQCAADTGNKKLTAQLMGLGIWLDKAMHPTGAPVVVEAPRVGPREIELPRVPEDVHRG